MPIAIAVAAPMQLGRHLIPAGISRARVAELKLFILARRQRAIGTRAGPRARISPALEHQHPANDDLCSCGRDCY